MQKKIESFFKHSSSPQPCNSIDLFDGIRAKNQSQIRIKYTRNSISRGESTSEGLIGEEEQFEEKRGENEELNLIKKRKYAQFHLELGQSDFLLHTCKVCGIKYAKGDGIDENFHSTFHKNFTHGIPFKGWRHERVIHCPVLEKGRIVVVASSDPLSQRKKVEILCFCNVVVEVQEVLRMMEIELGDGWIFHELCKVYLFVLSQRVAGCMIVEPISTAHRVITDSVKKVFDGACKEVVASKPKTLEFGGFCFQREVCKKSSTQRSLNEMDANLLGSIVYEEETLPACCGVRAIWVSPSNRRKHIATHLLDAVRKSFAVDDVLERTQLAFSQPTSAGKVLATKYTGTGSFLVYKL